MEEANPHVHRHEVGGGQKICQNDLFINLSNFCFGSNPARVITIEEAHSMCTGWRSGEVTQNTLTE